MIFLQVGTCLFVCILHYCAIWINHLVASDGSAPIAPAAVGPSTTFNTMSPALTATAVDRLATGIYDKHSVASYVAFNMAEDHEKTFR